MRFGYLAMQREREKERERERGRVRVRCGQLCRERVPCELLADFMSCPGSGERMHRDEYERECVKSLLLVINSNTRCSVMTAAKVYCP